MTDFTPRPYQGMDDLNRILQAVGAWNAAADGCGYGHPGDVRHFVTNMTRSRDSTRHLYFYEESGEILAVVQLYPPKFRGFGLMVQPDQRGSDLEAALITWAEAQIIESMKAEEIDPISVGTDAMDCDTIRAEMLVAQGYEPGAPWLYCSTRSLTEPIPESVLPEGFTIRSVTGEEESEALGVVHSSAFGSNWKPGEYLTVMQGRSFQIDHELVVVTPDGQLAAFLIYWVDPVSQTALFEPVGCHKDFQRRGLTRALMYEGMRRMQAEGAITAIVNHEPSEENPASAGLYASIGFKQQYAIHDYRKKLK